MLGCFVLGRHGYGSTLHRIASLSDDGSCNPVNLRRHWLECFLRDRVGARAGKDDYKEEAKGNVKEMGSLSHLDHLTPRAPDRAERLKLNKCSKGNPPESIGEATPSSGPVTLLVRKRLVLSPESTPLPEAIKNHPRSCTPSHEEKPGRAFL